MTTVHIKWFGAYDFNSFSEREIASQRGIYAFYRVFGGNETLFYIGKTERSFKQRFKEHQKEWLCNVRGQLKVRIGILEFPEGTKYSAQKLDHVESLLIVWHKPTINTTSSRYYTKRYKLNVINTGRRGLIEKVVSAENLDWE